jgi:hypothetical protein
MISAKLQFCQYMYLIMFGNNHVLNLVLAVMWIQHSYGKRGRSKEGIML